MNPAELLGALLPPDVVWRSGRIGAPVEPLWPQERPAIARARPGRRAEFTAGRQCARQALVGLTGASAPVPAAADRSPVWPDGIVGSITHDGPWCVAAVAWHVRIAGLGIDLTHVDGFHRALEPQVCAPGEAERLLGGCDDDGARLMRLALMFCIKEAVYKAQFPITGARLDFADVSLRLPRALPGRFTATLRRDAGVFRAGTRVRGRCSVGSGHCAAVAVVRRVSRAATSVAPARRRFPGRCGSATR